MNTLPKTVLQNCEHAIKVQMPEGGHNSHQWELFHCSNVYTVGDRTGIQPVIILHQQSPMVLWRRSIVVRTLVSAGELSQCQAFYRPDALPVTQATVKGNVLI